MPNILITNDDGIHAAGLRALVASVSAAGEVSVVAPHQERSASAQSITLRHPIVAEKIADREWSVEGTPTDSVILALNKLLPARPDLVISGINRGGNMGENVYYSGTVGAAMEATINHIPAVAISVASPNREYPYDGAAKLALGLAELILRERLPDGVLLNVNVPAKWSGAVRFTKQSQKVTRNVLTEGKDPRGRAYFWLHEQQVIEGIDPESDYAAIFDGAASITPIQLDRTHIQSLNHLSHWAKLLEGRLGG